MNKGIDRSNGNWLYFLGSDDKLFNNDTLLNLFDKVEDKFDLISGRIQYNFENKDSHFVKKNNGVFIPVWSKLIWLKNVIHHQGTIYNRRLFLTKRYPLEYKILSDYSFNLMLFSKGHTCKIITNIIAICGSSGLSKNYNWKLYQEEINLKTRQSSIVFYPIISLICWTKYLVKNKLKL